MPRAWLPQLLFCTITAINNASVGAFQVLFFKYFFACFFASFYTSFFDAIQGAIYGDIYGAFYSAHADGCRIFRSAERSELVQNLFFLT